MPPMLRVSGPSLLRELAYRNTLLGRKFNDLTTTQFLTSDTWALLAGSGWVTNAVDGGLKNISARFDGTSILNALLKCADINNAHIREVAGRKIDYGVFGASSGVTLINAAAIGPDVDSNPNIGIIKSIKVTEDSQNLINSVIPVGSGEGNNQFALGNGTVTLTTRNTGAGDPYNVSTATGPNGKTYYYLEDAASVAAYGRRQKVLASKDVSPIANSPTAFQNAANALYDLGAMYLIRNKDPLKVYAVEVTKLAPGFKVGDTLKIIYNGIAEDSVTSRRTWLSVNGNFVVLEKRRKFTPEGGYTWKLILASVARWLLDDAQVIIGALETLDVFRTGMKFYTMNVPHGPERESIDSTHNFDLSILYDNNVSRMLKCTLQFKCKVLRSNVKTVSSEASHTHTISGTTSGSGGSSTPTSTPAAGANYQVPAATHKHVFVTLTGNAVAPGFGPLSFADDAGKEFGAYVTAGANVAGQVFSTGATGTWATGNVSDVSHTHTVTISSHTHSVSGSTSSAGTSHNHTLTYGIFDDSAPANYSTSVYINGIDRTAALGGPWNTTATVSLDVSAYLVDANGHPLRQDNIVQFRTASAAAYDIVAQALSMITASAIEAA